MPEIRSRYSPRVRVSFDFVQPSRTQQHFKDECDIDRILTKYSQTGFLVDPLAPRREPLFGDFSESMSFMEAQTRIARVREAFDSLLRRFVTALVMTRIGSFLGAKIPIMPRKLCSLVCSLNLLFLRRPILYLLKLLNLMNLTKLLKRSKLTSVNKEVLHV